MTRELHTRFPDLRLSVNECDTLELDRGLRDARFDIVISTPGDHPGLQSIDLFEEKLWVCGPPEDLPLGDAGPVRLSQLSKRPFLTLGAGHRLSKLIGEIAREAGTTISAEYEGSSLDAARQMAVMGAGYAILPSLYALSEAKRDPDFIVREIDHPQCCRRIGLIWRPSSPLAREFQEVAKLMQSVAERLLLEEG